MKPLETLSVFGGVRNNRREAYDQKDHAYLFSAKGHLCIPHEGARGMRQGKPSLYTTVKRRGKKKDLSELQLKSSHFCKSLFLLSDGT